MFKTDKEQQDRAYNEMLKPIVQKLSCMSAKELAGQSGGTEDGGAVIIKTMQETVRVSIPSGEIKPALENWHSLVLLHYLCNADGIRPSGEWISFEDMKGGSVRGYKYVRSSYQWLMRFLKDKAADDIDQICKSLDGVKVDGKGDLNYALPFLPYFPVLFSWWEADEDFAATGKLLVDKNADHYFSIEDAVTVGEIIQKKMEGSFRGAS